VGAESPRAVHSPPIDGGSDGNWSLGPFAVLDLLGLGLFVASAAWAVASGALRDGHPEPMAALFLGCAVVFAASRLVSAVNMLVVPIAVAVVAGALAVASPFGTLSSSPLAGPLGYANAKAALFVQAAVAALLVAILVTGRRLRVVAAGAGVLFAIVPWVTGSVAAAAATLLLPVAWLLAHRPRAERWALVGVPAFLLVLGTTVLIGLAPPRSEGLVGGALDASLTRERLVLWHEATTMLRAEPLLGVGPGRFKEVSPTALSDSDLWWTHHGFLQQGAETGFVGLGLMISLFLWGFVRLGNAASRAVPILGVGLLALAVQACVDYVLHFGVVSLAASALVAVPATGAGSR